MIVWSCLSSTRHRPCSVLTSFGHFRYDRIFVNCNFLFRSNLMASLWQNSCRLPTNWGRPEWRLQRNSVEDKWICAVYRSFWLLPLWPHLVLCYDDASDVARPQCHSYLHDRWTFQIWQVVMANLMHRLPNHCKKIDDFINKLGNCILKSTHDTVHAHHGSYEWIIMLEKCGRLDLTHMSNWHLWQMKKIKILGAVLELLAK